MKFTRPFISLHFNLCFSTLEEHKRNRRAECLIIFNFQLFSFAFISLWNFNIIGGPLQMETASIQWKFSYESMNVFIVLLSFPLTNFPFFVEISIYKNRNKSMTILVVFFRACVCAEPIDTNLKWKRQKRTQKKTKTFLSINENSSLQNKPNDFTSFRAISAFVQQK